MLFRRKKEEEESEKKVKIKIESNNEEIDRSIGEGIKDVKDAEEHTDHEMGESVDIELRVYDAYLRDIGRSIARVDPEVMEELGLQNGDVIEIIGKNSVPAIVWPSYPEDRGKRIIRIDGSLRSNAGVGIDDKVRIRKVEAKPAEKLVIAPTEPIRFMGGETYLLKLLEGRPVKRGQKIRVEVYGHVITFVIFSTVPDGIVIVKRNTVIDLKEKPYKPIEERIKEEPMAMLEEWINRRIIVFTKYLPIIGVLKGYDREFNLILEEASFLENNELRGQYDSMVINGDNVVSVSLFEEIRK